MTIQWTLVAAFLYVELAFIFLLLLPVIPPKVWQYIFYSRFWRVLADRANVYFTIFLIVLVFFFLDSLREMWKYSGTHHTELGQELLIFMKLFRSQRNYFISGFAVFLLLVIRRLVTLVLCEADLLSENESAMKRAQNATETVEKILKKNEEIEREISLVTKVSVLEAEELHDAIIQAKNELNKTKKVVDDVRQKSQAVTAEYEILLEKHNELLNKLTENESKNTLKKVKEVKELSSEVQDEEDSDSDEEDSDSQ